MGCNCPPVVSVAASSVSLSLLFLVDCVLLLSLSARLCVLYCVCNIVLCLLSNHYNCDHLAEEERGRELYVMVFKYILHFMCIPLAVFRCFFCMAFWHSLALLAHYITRHVTKQESLPEVF